MESKTIVIVEDNAAIAQLIREVLNDVPGYGVVAVATGADALAVAAPVRADLVLLDIDLPDMTGFEVYDRLREHAATRAVPVLFMSAAPHAAALAERGIRDYLGKPFDLDDLLDRVRDLLVAPAVGLAGTDADAGIA